MPAIADAAARARLRSAVHAAGRAGARRDAASAGRCSTPCDGCDEHEGYRPDAVMILQPTSPLRQRRRHRAALALLERSGADSVVERQRGAGARAPDAHAARRRRRARRRCSSPASRCGAASTAARTCRRLGDERRHLRCSARTCCLPPSRACTAIASSPTRCRRALGLSIDDPRLGRRRTRPRRPARADRRTTTGQP